MTKKLSYADAVEELESILSGMENSEIDIDLLSEKVKRAAYLLKFCKARLKTAEKDVNQALDELNDAEQDDA